MRASAARPAPRAALPGAAAPRAASRLAARASMSPPRDDPAPPPAPSLLPWLARVTDDPALESRVALVDPGDGLGRRLVALRTLTPDEVIFNIPWSLVFADDDDDDSDDDRVDDDDALVAAALPWSARMAVRLLEERAARGPRLAWIESLPARVSTPPLEYAERALLACEDPAAIEEARSVAAAHDAAYLALAQRVRAAGADEDAFRVAVGAMHSRCFVHGPKGTHLAVPGVDMCNHSFERANAAVRVVTSPETCQGERATSEVAPPPPPRRDPGDADAADDARFFQLRAGEDGIDAGEEVTISYGAWPNDPFFLYFGFVPENNPNDSAILFRDAEDAARCAARAGLVASEADAAEIARGLMNETKGGGDDADDDEDDEGRGMMRRRMVLTRAGEVDAGVVRVAEALGVAWMDLVEARCRERMRAFETTLKEDRAKLAECEGGDEAGALADEAGALADEAVAVRFRMSKKEVLLGPLAAAQARARAIAES